MAEVDRLTRLVGDLLLINQTETGSMALHFDKVDLDVVLLDVFKQMKVISRRPGENETGGSSAYPD